MVVSMVWLFYEGVGIWGNNTTVVWGFPLANYVWWIGIGNAGTLISSMLLLMRQRWRASINRFAEAMTLFAATIAGLFPIMHLGRPQYFYWLLPYPNTMACLAAVAQRADLGFLGDRHRYILFSILFWYVGLIPDLATMRDRREHPVAPVFLRRSGARLARLGAALAPLRTLPHAPWPASPCRWWCRCTASSGSISPPA